MKSLLKTLIFFFIISTLFSSCNKDETYIYRSKKLILSAPEVTNDGIVLKWIEPLNGNIRSYSVQVSESQNFTNNYNGYTTNNTTYTITDVPLVEVLYFRVTAYGDSVILSNIQKLSMKIPHMYEEKADDVFAIPGTTNIILVQNYDNNKLVNINYAEEKVVNTINLFSNIRSYCIGLNNGKYEFYYTTSNTFYAINAFNFSNIWYKPFDYYIYTSRFNMTSDNNGHVYHLDDWNIYTYSINEKQLYSYYNSNLNGEIIYYSLNLNKLVNLGSNRTNYISLNTDGSISNLTTVQNSNYFSNYYPIENSDFARTNYSNGILNTNTLIVNYLPTQSNNIKGINYIKDVFYVIYSNSKSISLYSSTDFSYIKSFLCKGNPLKVITNGTDILAVSTYYKYNSSNGYSTYYTMVEKIK